MVPVSVAPYTSCRPYQPYQLNLEGGYAAVFEERHDVYNNRMYLCMRVYSTGDRCIWRRHLIVGQWSDAHTVDHGRQMLHKEWKKHRRNMEVHGEGGSP